MKKVLFSSLCGHQAKYAAYRSLLQTHYLSTLLVCHCVQREIGELKEQISIYESVHKVQSLFQVDSDDQLTGSYDDTLVELGIKQPSNKPPSCVKPSR